MVRGKVSKNQREEDGGGVLSSYSRITLFLTIFVRKIYARKMKNSLQSSYNFFEFKGFMVFKMTDSI